MTEEERAEFDELKELVDRLAKMCSHAARGGLLTAQNVKQIAIRLDEMIPSDGEVLQ